MIDNCDASVVIVFNLFLLGNHKNDRKTRFTSTKEQFELNLAVRIQSSEILHRIFYHDEHIRRQYVRKQFLWSLHLTWLKMHET